MQLGYIIAWRKKGCTIQKEKGWQFLDEYESRMDLGNMPSLKPLARAVPAFSKCQSRAWFATRVYKGTLSREEQLVWLGACFPRFPKNN